jgi:DNA-binding transcriptional MerR regulator
MVSIGEASSILGVDEATLRLWDEKGFLVAFRTPGNHRRYRKDDIDRVVGILPTQITTALENNTKRFIWAIRTTIQSAGDMDKLVRAKTIDEALEIYREKDPPACFGPNGQLPKWHITKCERLGIE